MLRNAGSTAQHDRELQARQQAVRRAHARRARRDPYKRAALLVFALAAATFLAWRTTQQAWFVGVFDDQGEAVPLALNVDALAEVGVSVSPTGAQPAIYIVLGYPAPIGMLVLGALLAGIGFALRMGLLVMIGAVAVWLARSSAVAVEQVLLDGAVASRFELAGANFDTYLFWVWVILALHVLLASQITYANHVERRREAAEGTDPEPNVLDTLALVQASALSRFSTRRNGTAGTRTNGDDAAAPADRSTS